MSPLRANQFKILLSDEELEMLKTLAEKRGLTASDYVRQLIRQEHDRDASQRSFKRPKRK